MLGIELIRFDMSEYMERHAVSRLIGAPPGYVGFDQGGLLTEAISKKPHAVLLMDEIEKAHPDVFNVLLQVMDHGTLTDNNGRKADFRSVIIVMTTNAGAETMNKATIGFTNKREQGDEMADIKRLFTPEFRNRLDAIVNFRSLDKDIILRVVDKFLLQLEGQLAEKKVEVTFTDGLRKHLAKKGFDPLMGARPMQRLIQDTIRRALADELLFGRLVDGGRLTVDVDDKGEVLLDIQPPRRATSRAPRRRRPRPRRGARPSRPPGPAGRSARTSRTGRGARACIACGMHEEGLAGDREELVLGLRRRRGRARCLPRARRAARRSRNSWRSRRRQSDAANVCRQQRHAVGHAVGHVQHMRKLVDHDVVADRRAAAGTTHVLPRQHHRTAFHGFARQHLVVVVHDAVVVGHLAPRHHLARRARRCRRSRRSAPGPAAAPAARPARRWPPPWHR